MQLRVLGQVCHRGGHSAAGPRHHRSRGRRVVLCCPRQRAGGSAALLTLPPLLLRSSSEHNALISALSVEGWFLSSPLWRALPEVRAPRLRAFTSGSGGSSPGKMMMMMMMMTALIWVEQRLRPLSAQSEQQHHCGHGAFCSTHNL